MDTPPLRAVSLRELAERFCLPLSTVVDAKETFDFYRTLEEGNEERVETGRREGSAFPSPSPPPSEANAVMGVTALQQFMRDMGAPKTSVEVTELLRSLVAVPAELEKVHAQERDIHRALLEVHKEAVAGEANRPGDAAAADNGGDGTPAPRDSRATPRTPPITPAVHLGEEESSRGNKLTLTFPQFLHLLRYANLGEEGAPTRPAQLRKETQAVFAALDADGDGALTERDVRAALARLLLEPSSGKGSVLATNEGLLKLAAMHPVELRAALDECDVNADGIVTVDDFVAVMHS